MPTIIHHGGGLGTFKSFSTIANHIIPQLKEGRTVITNIRGLDCIETVQNAINFEFPPSAELIYIDCDKAVGRKKMKLWWHWAPRGAFVVIDEAQKIYPKRLDIKSLDYPSRTVERDGVMVTIDGEEASDLDDRPFTFEDAFDEQRHYNWDLVLITPNIAKINSEIRGVAQIAYKHKRMDGIAPWKKNKWREFSHDPTDTGKTATRSPREYKADKRIFEVYRSTKTGDHTNSGAEKSILSDWKLLLFAGIFLTSVLAFFILLLNRPDSKIDNKDIKVTSEAANQIHSISNSHNDSSQHLNQTDNKTPSVSYNILERNYFDFEQHISIVGNYGQHFIFEVGYQDSAYQLTSDRLTQSGFFVKYKSDCHALIYLSDVDILNVRCALHRRVFEQTPQNNTNTIDLTDNNPFQSIVKTINE